MRGVSNKILDKFTGNQAGIDEQQVSYREIKKGKCSRRKQGRQ